MPKKTGLLNSIQNNQKELANLLEQLETAIRHTNEKTDFTTLKKNLVKNLAFLLKNKGKRHKIHFIKASNTVYNAIFQSRKKISGEGILKNPSTINKIFNPLAITYLVDTEKSNHASSIHQYSTEIADAIFEKQDLYSDKNQRHYVFAGHSRGGMISIYLDFILSTLTQEKTGGFTNNNLLITNYFKQIENKPNHEEASALLDKIQKSLQNYNKKQSILLNDTQESIKKHFAKNNKSTYSNFSSRRIVTTNSPIFGTNPNLLFKTTINIGSKLSKSFFDNFKKSGKYPLIIQAILSKTDLKKRLCCYVDINDHIFSYQPCDYRDFIDANSSYMKELPDSHGHTGSLSSSKNLDALALAMIKKSSTDKATAFILTHGFGGSPAQLYPLAVTANIHWLLKNMHELAQNHEKNQAYRIWKTLLNLLEQKNPLCIFNELKHHSKQQRKKITSAFIKTLKTLADGEFKENIALLKSENENQYKKLEKIINKN